VNPAAVVVGGGRGMGFAIAGCFADEDALVAVIARSWADHDCAAVFGMWCGATVDVRRRWRTW